MTTKIRIGFVLEFEKCPAMQFFFLALIKQLKSVVFTIYVLMTQNKNFLAQNVAEKSPKIKQKVFKLCLWVLNIFPAMEPTVGTRE